MTETHGPITLHHGDCLDALATLPDASVDAVVTDPPYGLANTDPAHVAETITRWVNGERDYLPGGAGFMGKAWDAFVPPVAVWDECLRVLKPGGHVLAFAGSRTVDLMTLGLRLAGFDIRDSVAWLYGSGFPKSLDVSKAIDKTRTEDRAPVDAVRAWLNARRLDAGFSHDAVNRHFGHASNGGGSSSAWMTNPTSKSLPTWGQWQELKALFGFSNEMDAEVRRLNDRKGVEGDNWHAREVVGMHAQSDPRLQSWAEMQGKERGTAKEMRGAPATPDAARWQGWGTALKPAFEPVVVARKPLAGTVAANVLEWGCGAINIDACRIQSDGSSGQGSSREAATRWCRVHDVRPLREADGAVAVAGQEGEVADDVRAGVSRRADARGEQSQLAGRDLDGEPFGVSSRVGGEPVTGGPGATADATTPRVPGAPASDGSQDRATADGARDGASHQRREGGQPAGEPALDGLGGSLSGAPSDRARVGGTPSGERPPEGCTCGADREVTRAGEASADRRYTERGGTNFAPLPGVRGGSPAGRWPANVVLDESQAEVLDQQSGESAPKPERTGRMGGGNDNGTFRHGDPDTIGTWPADSGGGASRFFYVAKADSSERVRVDGIAHPTVKPLALMRWLVRLVTPPGGTVLEPFAGSGTTVEAAILEGFHCVAIEREADYLPLIRQRIHRRRDPVEAVKGSGEELGLFDLLDEETA